MRSHAPSDSSFVVNRWPSEILSISTAIASIDCSMRSSRFCHFIRNLRVASTPPSVSRQAL